MGKNPDQITSLLNMLSSNIYKTVTSAVFIFLCGLPFTLLGQNKVVGESFETTSKDSVSIAYTVYGNQEDVLLFVHGWTCDQTYWKAQIPFFSKQYKVVTLDLGGHGNSTTGNRTEWTMERFAEDVLSVIADLEYSSLTLVGHSMGAIVVLKTAAEQPENLEHIVCIDYLISPLQAKNKKEVDEGLLPFEKDFYNMTKRFVPNMFNASADANLKERIAEDMAQNNPEVAISAAAYLAATDYTQTFEALQKNVSLKKGIVNADKRPTDVAHYSKLGFTVDIIENSHHFMMLDQPEIFNATLQKILKD